MSTIQLEISDELAEQLAPHQDRLVDLLRLGLQQWQENERQKQQSDQAYLLQLLIESGQVIIPKPAVDTTAYIRQTPVPLTGKATSEIVIEQRGQLE